MVNVLTDDDKENEKQLKEVWDKREDKVIEMSADQLKERQFGVT